MDDDDEFGDLYADVIHPLPSPPKPLASAAHRSDDSILGPAPIPEDDPPLRWSIDADDPPIRAPEAPAPAPVPVSAADGEQGIGDFDIEQDIPGIGAAGVVFDVKPPEAGSEDWDSDSDDDLRIVLNDDGVGGRRGGIEEDEDGEDDDLVIVADDGPHAQYQGLEEQEWGEEALQAGLDGEKKEGGEAAKVGGVGAAVGQRVGYGHVYHPQHHSQFKYIRPGAVDIPGGSSIVHGGAPSQVRPPITMGLAAGRGRGMQKGFHSGYGSSSWANNNLARPFGIGLDFTLPSHKTIFDVNIDAFEEKPWKLPGIDITDFFNFALDESSWKDYCRQLEQFRIESTMQSKIRVYESGRSDHDYDPELPPELAAASGIQDLSTDKTHHGKMDSGQLDLCSQGVGALQRHSQLPTGRAIQVESGYGERLPSMDTRPPRTRDFEAIIEIVCQDFVDESDKLNTELDQPGPDPAGDSFKGCFSSEENNRHDGTEHSGRVPCPPNDRRVPIFSEVSTVGSAHEGGPEGHEVLTLTTKAPAYADGSSKPEISSCAVENLDESHEERVPMTMMDKSTESYINAGNDSELSPSNGPDNTKEPSIENGVDEPDDELDLPDSQGEGENLLSDLHVSSGSQNDQSLSYSTKKVKLNSQVEHPAMVDDDAEDLGTTFSDHSIIKSGSSMEYAKQVEVGDDEVMQAEGCRDSDDLRREHSEGGCISPQRDDYVQESQPDINGGHIPPKGGDHLRRSQPRRALNSNSADYQCAEGFERLEERGGSTASWSRRDGDAHDLGRKDRDAKRRQSEEVRSKDRNRSLMSDRKIRGDDVHPRKSSENNDWRSQSGREGGLRQRERNNILMKQNECFEDGHINRRKDEEQRKRESISKENLHGYRVREDASHSRRGRNDSSESRMKEDVARVRDRIGNPRSSKHKDDSSKPREREDRQRPKTEGYANAHRDREDVRSGSKSSRILDDKSYGANLKNRGDRNGSDNDLLLKDRRQDQLRRGERSKGEGHSQYKNREEFNASISQVSREEKGSRHGRLSNQGAHSSGAFSNQHMYRENIDRENSKRSRNLTADQNGMVPAKRKHEDFIINQRDKSRRTSPLDSIIKGGPYQEANNGSDGAHAKKDIHSQVEKAEGTGDPYINTRDETVSDDENQLESRKGRSKLERWTSHKERDYNLHRGQPSLRSDHVNGSNQDIVLDELTMTEVNKDAEGLDNKDSLATENSTKEERDRHLETVEKLKKRSERFNLPMPSEKEIAATKRVENDISLAQNESLAESEIKQERPTRKRRWVSG